MTDKKTVLWLLKNTGKYRWYIVCLVLLQMVLSGSAVCYALAMKSMIDSVVAGNRQGFFTGLFLFIFLIIMQLGLRMVLRYLEEASRTGLENRFKENLFGALLKKDYGQVSAVHSAEWMNRMTSDTAVCGNGLTEILPGFLGMLVRMAGAMVLLFLLQPQLAYIMVPCGLAFVGITLILRKYLKVFHKRVQEKDGEVRVYLQERISSMLVLRTFGAEDIALNGAKKEFDELKSARIKKAVVSNLSNTGFVAAINGMQLLGIGYCGYGILNGVVSYGTLTAVMQLIGQLQVPLSGISGFVPRFYAMIASAERLMEVETCEDAGSETVKSLEETKRFYKEELSEIFFENVSFSYTDDAIDAHVLKNVNLHVKKGDYVAITGTSGCGKSTLLKLLMGIYMPQDGVTGVCKKDGVKEELKDYRRLFSYVPQGNYLMSGTIREVIAFWKKENAVEEEAMKKALYLAGGAFVFELPDGLDTVLGEKGAGLSEGQMQRIAIARALYADTPVLILDEATSALDEAMEKEILENLKNLTDKTVFFVTHRTEALKICNKKICFQKDGIAVSSES